MRVSLLVEIEMGHPNKEKINAVMSRIRQAVYNRHQEVIDIRPAAIRPDEWEDEHILGTLLSAVVNKNGGEMFIPMEELEIGRVALNIDNTPMGSQLKLVKTPDFGGYYPQDS
jgi:rhodanese-related sulfurtransferase